MVKERICLQAFSLLVKQNISVGINTTDLDLTFQDIEYVSATSSRISQVRNILIRLTYQSLPYVNAKRKREDEINILIGHLFDIVLAIKSAIQNEQTLFDSECFDLCHKVL